MKKFFAALLAIIMLFSLFACGRKKEEKFNWNDIRLHEIIPKFNANKGEIHTNSDDELWIDISGISENQYNDYVDSCKNDGFTVDSKKDSISYEAFNADGYKLKLSYYDDELSIQLDAPMEMKDIQWPKSDIADLLPVPKSNFGKIEWEADYGFVIYLGNTSLDDFNEYANACAENGFTVDYRRGDNYYYANNSDGYHLSLNYEGNNIMFVRIDEPDDKEKTPDTSETSVDETETPDTNETPMGETNEPDNTSTPVDGIRPEFKEAMDSYEEFFDEYAAFMKKYAESGYSLDMISDYTKFMSQYTETMDAMEKLGEEEMSTEETAYYLEVTTRINNKLLNSLS